MVREIFEAGMTQLDLQGRRWRGAPAGSDRILAVLLNIPDFVLKPECFSTFSSSKRINPRPNCSTSSKQLSPRQSRGWKSLTPLDEFHFMRESTKNPTILDLIFLVVLESKLTKAIPNPTLFLARLPYSSILQTLVD